MSRFGALRDGDHRVGPPRAGRDQPEVDAADLAPGVLGQDELDHVVDRDDRRPRRPDRVGPVRAVQQVDLLAGAGAHDADLFPPHLLDVFAEPRQRADRLRPRESDPTAGARAPCRRAESAGASSMYCWSLSSSESRPSSRCSRCCPMPRRRLLQEERVDADSHARRHVAVHVEQALGGAAPGVLRGALEALGDQLRPQRRVGQRELERYGQAVDVCRVDQQRGALGDFWQAGRTRSDYRRAARHRLEDRQAESLVQRGKGEHVGRRVERRQQLVWHEAGQQDVVAMPATRRGARRYRRTASPCRPRAPA